MTRQVRIAMAAAGLLLLGACADGSAPVAQAPSAARPNAPALDTGSMALPTANSAAGNVSTTRVR